MYSSPVSTVLCECRCSPRFHFCVHPFLLFIIHFESNCSTFHCLPLMLFSSTVLLNLRLTNAQTTSIRIVQFSGHHLLPKRNSSLFGTLPTMSISMCQVFCPFYFTQIVPRFSPIEFWFHFSSFYWVNFIIGLTHKLFFVGPHSCQRLPLKLSIK